MWLRAAGDALELAPTHIVALLVVASCACAGMVALWWTARPSVTPAAVAGLPSAPAVAGGADVVGGAGAAGAGAAAVPSAPPDEVVVHVSGAVKTPGVRTLPGSARVDDAVRAAGGTTGAARTDQLNLARPLRDGEQIHVPDASEAAAMAAGAAEAAGAGGGAARGTAGGAALVNINRATAAELDALPNIGPVLAERIVAHRDAQGGFTSVDELQQVSGIGEKTYADLKDLVTL